MLLLSWKLNLFDPCLRSWTAGVPSLENWSLGKYSTGTWLRGLLEGIQSNHIAHILHGKESCLVRMVDCASIWATNEFSCWNNFVRVILILLHLFCIFVFNNFLVIITYVKKIYNLYQKERFTLNIYPKWYKAFTSKTTMWGSLEVPISCWVNLPTPEQTALHWIIKVTEINKKQKKKKSLVFHSAY